MLVIGRALMARPRLMMLDEPSLGLAPLLVKEIFRVISQMSADEGMTILLVEQNARIALSVADYAYVMENGRVVLDGPAEQLARKRGHQRVLPGPDPTGRAQELPRRQTLQAPQTVAGVARSSRVAFRLAQTSPLKKLN